MKVICKGFVDIVNENYIGLIDINIGRHQFNHIWIKNNAFETSKYDKLQFFGVVEKYKRTDGTTGYGIKDVNEIKIIK